ncbi:hypothetical protein BDV18DRAFT_43321 [Aspergillus unguis]
MDGRGPYGLACLNCFKGKVKCVAREDGQGCERCFRLRKNCVPSHSVRRRAALENMQGSRIEQMDAKLDTLLDMMQAMHEREGGDAEAEADDAEHNNHEASPPNEAGPSNQNDGMRPPELSPTTQPALPTLDTLLQPPQLMTDHEHTLTLAKDRDPEAALALFRDKMLRYCPFLYLAPDLSARELQRERPFLVEVILAVTTRSVQEKLLWGKRIKSIIAQSLVVDYTASMDILLGLLVYASWSQDHFILRLPTLSRFMSLAISVVDELHLSKGESLDRHRLVELGGGNDPKFNRSAPPFRTAEQKRAVLGCFMISSYVSIYFTEMDPMRFTSQMEQDLCFLAANPEWPGDVALATHVRLQLLVQNAVQLRDEQGTLPHLPFFLKSFRSQLDSIRSAIPPQLLNEPEILSQLHYTELSIHETAYTANIDPQSPMATFSNSAIGPDAADCMWHSVMAIKSWFHVHFMMPTETFTQFSIITWCQLSRALVTLFRLTVHPASDWDRLAVRNTLDMAQVVDDLRERFGHVAPNPGGPFPDDMWTRGGLLLWAIRSWIHQPGRLGGLEGTTAMPATTGPGMVGPPGLPTWDGTEASLQAIHTTMQFSSQPWMGATAYPPGSMNGGMHY